MRYCFNKKVQVKLELLSGDGSSCKVDKNKLGVCEPRSEIVSGNDVANSPMVCEAGVVWR